MSALRIIPLVILVAVVWLISQAFFVVNQKQTALVLRFGEVSRVVKDAGLHFKLPIADEVVDIENRIFMWKSDNMEVQASGSQLFLVDTITLARVNDPKKFRETVGADLDLAKQRIETRVDAALRQTYGTRSFEAALSKDRNDMMREIRDTVRSEVLALGIEIVDVRIRRTDLLPGVMDSTYERMKSEKLAQAQNTISTGEALNTSMKAEADRKVVEIVSEGKRQSEVIRGEGEAERASTFAAAFTKDPEFYAFYRSMQAYDKSLSSGGTNLVLSPNSEFFRYFGGQKDMSQVPAAKP